MDSSKLTALQTRVLEVLAGLQPAWTLTGGAALAGFHLGHRATRDLDLFVHGRSTLDDYAQRVIDRLQTAGLGTSSLQGGASFHRLQVHDAHDSVLLDLVAEPVPSIEPPMEHALGSRTVRIDTRHEILVNKLCTLIQRSELRDLVDVQALLDAGGDFERALHDAPKKDGGFSPLVLTWQLQGLELETMARAQGWAEEQIRRLVAFRSELTAKLGKFTRPE